MSEPLRPMDGVGYTLPSGTSVIVDELGRVWIRVPYTSNPTGIRNFPLSHVPITNDIEQTDILMQIIRAGLDRVERGTF